MEPAYGTAPLRADDEEDVQDPQLAEMDADEEIVVRRAEIEVTRTELSETIDAIKDKLDPQHLVEQAKDSIHDATIGKAQGALSGAMDSVKETVSNVMDKAKQFAQGSQGSAERDYSQPYNQQGYYEARTSNGNGSLMDTIKENPIPVALIGIGLGWLLMNARKGRSHHYDYGYNSGYRYGTYGAAQPSETPRYESNYTPGQTTQSFSGQGTYTQGGYGQGAYGQSTYGQGTYGSAGYQGTGTYSGQTTDSDQTRQNVVGEKLGQVKENLGGVASNVQQGAVDMAQGVKERAGQAANEAQYQAMRLKLRAQEAAGQAGDVFGRTLQDNPLAIAAAAVGLGLAVGLLLPETQKEHQLMGETKDRLMDQAKDVAQDLGQKAQTVAQETFDVAKDTAKQAAQDQGLTAGATTGQANTVGLGGSSFTGSTVTSSTTDFAVDDTTDDDLTTTNRSGSGTLSI